MAQRWERVQSLFEAALEQPVAAREGWLRETCADDEGLYAEVASLVASDTEDEAFFDTPVADVAAALVDEAATDLPVGTRVDQYVVEARLGEGGFGAVYRARHVVIGKLAAIKVLHPEHGASTAVAERFVNEARAVNEIGHPNIIDVFGFGKTADGRLYYTMEYVDAPSLEEALRTDGRLSLARALPILRGLAAALDAAHDRGIVHRDLKPANVLVTRAPDGAYVPKLLDFGIAKLANDDAPVARTQTGQLLGTPAYMAPEQIRGQAVDGRTDAYAFGVLAYRMLTGEPPFAADTAFDTMVLHAQEEPPRPSERVAALGPAVDAFVLALLAKDPERRPARLGPHVDAVASAAAEPGSPSSSRRPWHAAVVLGAIAAAGIVAYTWTRMPAEAPEPARPPAAGPSAQGVGPSTAAPSSSPEPVDASVSADLATTGETPSDVPEPRREGGPQVDPAGAKAPTPPPPRRRTLHGDLESPFGR